MKLRVWAPTAQSVTVQCDDEGFSLISSEDGYWECDTANIPETHDYFVILDNVKKVPDPRSAYQPHGVHGASRFVDHGQFAWEDQHWESPPLSSAIIYELHVGTFSADGTFDGAIQQLDYLSNLGITHVELMPIAEFSGERGWGYDGVDLFAPHHAYGGPDGLKRLINACHRRGLAVLLDVVYNHFGPSGNYLREFGPYLTSRYTTPWGDAINFDGPYSDQVRRFFCDNAAMWLRDYHFDGLRLDAVHAIIDTSAIHILEELASHVANLGRETQRRFLLIAESDLNDPRIIKSDESGGYGIDAQWSDDFHHALHTVLTGETSGYYTDFGDIADLAKALQHAFVYDGQYSRFRKRRHGRSAEGVNGNNFLGYLQNHDQIGNRAQGERASSLMSEARLRIGAALIMTAPFVPMLFQGEEWASSRPFLYFTGHEDQELGSAVSEGRKREFAAFGWKAEEIPDPQAVDSFHRSKLDWKEKDQEPHRSLLDWYRELIELRKHYEDLCDGRLDKVALEFDERAQWLVMTRGAIRVACNFSRDPQQLMIPEGGQLKMKSDGSIKVLGDHLFLPAESVAIMAY
jgi:maltooligosyltrehalose trehalohydrolase